MHVLLVSATPFEIAPLIQWLEAHFTQQPELKFERGNLQVEVMITGVGMTATAFQLGYFFAQHRPDWAINAGIAGAFDRSLSLGDVVQVVEERFGDLGVEESDGRFTDLEAMGFVPQSVLNNPNPVLPELKACRGLTVNKVHGTEASIQKILDKYPGIQVESMEGAAFFYACLSAKISFVELRSISNRVEPRNRDAWNLPLAIQLLNEQLIAMLDAI